MKIEVQADELFTCVGDLKRILDAPDVERATIDAKSDGTEKGHIVLRGIYCDEMAELKVHGRVVEPGVAGVRFDRLEQACSAFLRHEVTVSSDASYLRIECGQDRVTLATTVAHERLPAPSDAAPRAVFDSADFITVMSDVVHAKSDDYACRRSLCGIQFEVGTDMKLRAIATDGRRLAASARQIRRAELPSASFEVFLPREAVEFAARVLAGETIIVYNLGKAHARRIGIATGGSYGEFGNDVAYPKWRDVVPKDPAFRAMFIGGELADAMLRAINALDIRCEEVDEEGEPVETAFNAHIYAGEACDQAEITVQAAIDGGDASVFTTVSCTTPEAAKFKTDINARYLLEAVRCHEGAVEVYANQVSDRCEQLGPFVLKFPEEPDYFEVIMPLRSA